MADEATVTSGGGIYLDAERLDYELARRGMTYPDLARESGVDPTTISKSRHGHLRVRAGVVSRLAGALERHPVDPVRDAVIRKPERAA